MAANSGNHANANRRIMKMKLYDFGFVVAVVYITMALFTMNENNVGNHETHPENDPAPIEYKSAG